MLEVSLSYLGPSEGNTTEVSWMYVSPLLVCIGFLMLICMFAVTNKTWITLQHCII